jgi:hypothetical protein
MVTPGKKFEMNHQLRSWNVSIERPSLEEAHFASYASGHQTSSIMGARAAMPSFVGPVMVLESNFNVRLYVVRICGLVAILSELARCLSR